MIRSIHKKTIYTLLFFLNFTHLTSQNNDIKRLQRAIFIFNFAEQVTWPTPLNQKITIGILGKDSTVDDIKNLAEKRKIKNKPVLVKQFNSIRDIKNVQLIFVNKKYDFDINYLLQKISKQGILLVTEDYTYHTSMINIISVNNSYAYEINESLLKKENFNTAPTLKQYAISSSEKWRQLYQNKKLQLDKVEEKKQEQEKLIENKEQQIEDQKQEIKQQKKKIEIQKEELTDKNKSILQQNQALEALLDETELQEKKYNEKLKIEKQLEERIKNQLKDIKQQQENITSINNEILNQQIKLEKQKEEIIEKESILKEQNIKLNTQKTISYLLITLFSLALLICFIVYRSYKSVKKFNSKLASKNDKIYKQSVLLESKNKELEQFAYITSHDLKEPLNTIASFSKILQEDYKSNLDDNGLIILDFIASSSTRGLSFIDALLEYSRLGESEVTDIDCNAIVNHVSIDLSNVISRNKAIITKENLPHIKGSTIELRLVFQNLINNAIKFRKKETSPQVYISCEKVTPEGQTSDFWQFSIADNGIGIPEKFKERIFVIFQRLHTKEQYEGTGIGLAYCKKIIESLGGEIWFDSEVGKGTTFYFTIPI
ncbi:YfiR/HmsC family protein [Tenacibaculum agarivorans]|uniref:YfiR/HmsC family protein n=1 Tax=Tenacibaculum agarivorans TaxID=1908389 RepID=UPI00094B9EF9|nr:YfiR/HmsC family protein [Tenacibaculum agarivorans]